MTQIYLTNSNKAYHYLKNKVSKVQEEFWIVALNNQKNVLKAKCLFRGTANHCHVHPRDIIFFLCNYNAISFLICHTHPQSCVTPSHSDIKVTKEILNLSQIIKIPLNDHLIINRPRYFSFKDYGLVLKN